MSAEIILYDIPSRDAAGCWSLNTWKSRAALNFKQLPYRTQWVEYPDLATTLPSLGLSPNAKVTPYTAPAVRLPDGSHIMQSLPIAQALEALQPLPALRPDDEVVSRVQKIFARVFNAFFRSIAWRIADLLPERSAEYFHRTRQEFADGMPLREWADSQEDGEAWGLAEPHLQACVELLKENDGPYVLGREASYADLVLGSLWRCLERADEGLAGRVLGLDPVLREHWMACQEWFERSD